MSVTAAIDVTRGSFRLTLSLEAASGQTIAVVGPNGSGKTTLLRTLAGLERNDGTLRLDDVDVARRPPHLRPVGWVPQDGALFPHLSARDNVAFGIGGRSGRAEAQRWLGLAGVADLADRRPGQLSGGQAQKVALTRALARNPQLLLLDEPLAALDSVARSDVRRSLRRHLRDFAGVTLLVTHDPVDALSLADRVVALDAGRVVQDAPPVEVARRPRSSWLATLMGANGLPGRIAGRTLELDEGGTLTVAEAAGPDGAEALAVLPAHGVTLHATRPAGSARNAWPVVVRDLAVTGSRVRVRCDGPPAVVAEITPEAAAELRLADGVEAWASVKATEVTVVRL